MCVLSFIIILDNMKIIVLTLLNLGFVLCANAQARIDYLSYDYKHLNENYDIVIRPEVFDSLLKKGGVNPLSLRTYSDSLMVVLLDEFDNYKNVRAAAEVLNFSWEKAAYYIWKTEKETKALASEMGKDSHPWRFMQSLQNDKSQTTEIVFIMKELRAKVEKAVGEPMPADFTNAQVLEMGFETNPTRLVELARIKAAAASCSSCKTGSCGTLHNHSDHNH